MQRFKLIGLQLRQFLGLIDLSLLRRQLWIDGFVRKLQSLLLDLIPICQLGLFYF
jgi:hypothetical protein